MQEREVKRFHVLLETLPKWALLVAYLIFFWLLVFALIIGSYSGPKVYDSVKRSWNIEAESIIVGNASIKTGFTPISNLNQEFWFNIYIANNPNSSISFSTKAYMKLDLQGSNMPDDEEDLIPPFEVYGQYLDCDQGEQWCHKITAMHESNIGFNYYLATVTFYNLKPLFTRGLLGREVQTEFLFYNQAYTIFEIVVRYFLVVLNIIVLFVFVVMVSSKQSNIHEWHTEQKWVLVLLSFALGFNNPLYPLDFYVHGWFFPFLNLALFSTYVHVLLLCLLIITHAVLVPFKDRTRLGFYAPKILLVGSMWLLSVAVFAWQKFAQRTDPGVVNLNQMPFYKTVQYAAVSFGLLYVTSVIFHTLRAYGNLNRIPHAYSARFKVVWTFTAIVIGIAMITYTVILFLGASENAVTFIFFRTLLTLYPMMMAFFFLPSHKAQVSSIDDLEQIFDSEGEEDEDEEAEIDDDDDDDEYESRHQSTGHHTVSIRGKEKGPSDRFELGDADEELEELGKRNSTAY